MASAAADMPEAQQGKAGAAAGPRADDGRRSVWGDGAGVRAAESGWRLFMAPRDQSVPQRRTTSAGTGKARAGKHCSLNRLLHPRRSTAAPPPTLKPHPSRARSCISKSSLHNHAPGPRWQFAPNSDFPTTAPELQVSLPHPHREAMQAQFDLLGSAAC
jgi:hypothetical protein